MPVLPAGWKTTKFLSENHMKVSVGDIVWKDGLKAQVDLLYKDAEYARVVLFPQPGVSGNARYQDWPLDKYSPVRR